MEEEGGILVQPFFFLWQSEDSELESTNPDNQTEYRNVRATEAVTGNKILSALG